MKIIIFIALAFLSGCHAAYVSRSIEVSESTIDSPSGSGSYATIELLSQREFTGTPFKFEDGKYQATLTLKGSLAQSSNFCRIILYPEEEETKYRVDIVVMVNGVGKFLDGKNSAITILRSSDGNYISLKWDGTTYEPGKNDIKLPFGGIAVGRIER